MVLLAAVLKLEVGAEVPAASQAVLLVVLETVVCFLRVALLDHQVGVTFRW